MLFPSLVLSFLRLKSDGPSACLTLRFSPALKFWLRLRVTMFGST